MICFDGVIESDLVHATCEVITFTLAGVRFGGEMKALFVNWPWLC